MKTYVQFLRRLLVHKILFYMVMLVMLEPVLLVLCWKIPALVFIRNVDIAVYSLANSHVICADNWL